MKPDSWHSNRKAGTKPRQSFSSASKLLWCGLLFAVIAPAQDFPSRFQLVPGSGAAESFSLHQTVVRRGKPRDAIVLVAPATIRAPLSGYGGNLLLECDATPVYNIGDGMQLTVAIRTGSAERQIFTRYFDAGRRAEDREWVHLSIPLAVTEPSTSELVITVSGGPHGDLVADWLALASIRIIQRTQPL